MTGFYTVNILQSNLKSFQAQVKILYVSVFNPQCAKKMTQILNINKNIHIIEIELMLEKQYIALETCKCY